MVERMEYEFDSELTPQTARLWTETSPNSKLKDINKELNSVKGNKIDKLKDLIQKREYKRFQKEIGLTSTTDRDGKLGRITFETLKYYLESLDEIKTSQQSDLQELDTLKLSVTQSPETIQDNISSQIDGNKFDNGASNPPAKIDGDKIGNGVEKIPTQDTGPTLLSFGNDRHSIEQGIFNEWPKLGILGKKLEFDWTSKLSFIKPHLNDLNKMSEPSLLKLKKVVKGIRISDKTVTSRESNKSLLGVTPRGYPSDYKWDTVGGCLRGNIVYAGRAMRPDGSYYSYEEAYGNNNKEYSDSLILHEIGHAFDKKYDVSTRPSFKTFHKRFYDRIGSYFQQGGPGGTVGCEEFFAEASAEFHKRGEETFSKYYSKDFYDYMKGILC